MSERTITCHDLQFTIALPFEVGHVLAANEADALNSTFVENIRNNINSQLVSLKKANKFPTQEEYQAVVDEYVTNYQFGVKRTRGQSASAANPINKIAFDIAKTLVKEALKKANHNLKAEGMAERIVKLAKDLLGHETRGPAILIEAERRYEESQKIGIESLGDLALPV